MEPPVCTRCGISISNRYVAYREMIKTMTPEQALVALRIAPTDMCCRMHYLTTVNIYELRHGKYRREDNLSVEFGYPAAANAAANADSQNLLASMANLTIESENVESASADSAGAVSAKAPNAEPANAPAAKSPPAAKRAAAAKKAPAAKK